MSAHLASGIYEGTVTHHRFEPVPHGFAYRIAIPYLDLGEVDDVCALHPLWSAERANLVSIRRADFLGNPGVPLDTAVRDLVEERSGTRPGGPIRMLAHVRTWGWLFNPISLYYCYDPTGTILQTTVAEVSNTPWHERTAYVLTGGEGHHEVGKALHVSPFLPMDLVHRFRIGSPGTVLSVGVDDTRDGRAVFTASMRLTFHPASRHALGHLVWGYPGMTVRVSAGIYRQALSLRLRGAPFHRHPGDVVAGGQARARAGLSSGRRRGDHGTRGLPAGRSGIGADPPGANPEGREEDRT